MASVWRSEEDRCGQAVAGGPVPPTAASGTSPSPATRSRPRRGGALAPHAPGNPAAVEVVRRKLDLHAVTDADSNVILAHLAAEMRQHLVAAVQLHGEERVGQGFLDHALHHDLRLVGLPARPVSAFHNSAQADSPPSQRILTLTTCRPPL